MEDVKKANATLAARYDEWGDTYELLTRLTNYQGGEWIKEKKQLFNPGAASVLDLACADGFIATILAELRPEYIFDGIDFSAEMLKAAKEKNLYRELIQADLNAGLPKQDLQKYDYVIATAFLEYIQSIDRLLCDVRDVLRPDGLIFLTLQKHNPELKDTILDVTYFTFSDTNAIVSQIEGAGLEVMQVEEGVGYWDASDGLPRDYFFVIAGLPN